MLYNREFFEQFCKDKKLVLLNDYNDVKISSRKMNEILLASGMIK